MRKVFPLAELKTAPLVVDAAYAGGSAGNTGDDPIGKVLKVGNQGGFRYLGSPSDRSLKYLVLYTNLADPDWPDLLDEATGEFHYYGDNKKPGHGLHETRRQGNTILRDIFAALHERQRDAIPPIFIFTKSGIGRDVIFRGLAVPGSISLNPTEDLIAIWKSKDGERFQNYKAVFTILDVPEISRAWIQDIEQGKKRSPNAPANFIKWLDSGKVSPLQAEPTIVYRTKEQQLPKGENDIKIVQTIYEYFRLDPYRFEHCSAEITRLMDKNVVSYELTRPWVDGGRDVLGKYRIGGAQKGVDVDFAIEAKCYAQDSGLGVDATTRLISRLRYRQFGVFVTTSFVSLQAYKEIVEDRHPVIVVASGDISGILKNAGYKSPEDVGSWLSSNFPK
jgi:hypothetical protein